MTTKPIQQPQTTPSSQPTQPLFYSAYSPKIRSQISFAAEGRTKQSFKDECDINTIMKRYEQTGALTHLNNRQPVFGDMAEIDFQGSLNIVLDARDRFAQLPSAVRDRFGNDPAQLLDFIQNESNREEAVKLGLIRVAEQPNPPVPPEPVKAPVPPEPVKGPVPT